MWITVIGEGSFSLYRGPIWRGPNSHEISDEQAAECLAYKEKNPDSNLFVISTEKPAGLDEYGKPDWQLRPQDLFWNRPAANPDEPDIASPDADYEAPPDEYPCNHCGASFTSAAGLDQHIALKHFAVHAQVEQEAREQLAAEKQRKVIEQRIRQVDPKELHPAERPDEPDTLRRAGP